MHLANPDRQTPERSSCSSEGYSLRFTTILLVEDESFVRGVASEVLCSAGYRVLQARNAAEAVLAFRSQPEEVDLLLTDVVLPDRSGCDLALELLTLDQRMKAIFVSGYAENPITRKGLQQPGWCYLAKPFSAGSLLRAVKEVISCGADTLVRRL